MDTLEIVKTARDDVAQTWNYSYGDWRHCAVGHVYKAVTGEYARTTDEVTGGASYEFRQVINEINLALGSHEILGCAPLSQLADPLLHSESEKDAALRAYDQVIDRLTNAHDQELVA